MDAQKFSAAKFVAGKYENGEIVEVVSFYNQGWVAVVVDFQGEKVQVGRSYNDDFRPRVGEKVRISGYRIPQDAGSYTPYLERT